jgi:hypothetical protein
MGTLFLKQSTAVNVLIGPFIDDGDGKTAETGLTLAQADIRLSKNGGNMAQKTEATSCTHDELGYYSCPLDTTDTATLGNLKLMVHQTGSLPVFHDFMVVTTNVYDTLCSTDVLNVEITAVGVDAVLDEVVESTLTLRQAIRLLTAATHCNKTSGGGTATLIARDYGDTLDRITKTVDANGNTTAVSVNTA